MRGIVAVRGRERKREMRGKSGREGGEKKGRRERERKREKRGKGKSHM